MTTMADIVALSDKGLNDSQIVGELVVDDFNSYQKNNMVTAERYYDNHNDVEMIDFTAYKGADGTDKQNLNRSNRHISHNFLKLLINQAVNYIAGNPITYKAEDDTFQQWLDESLMFDFDDANIEWLKESRKKGKGYLHIYYDGDGNLAYAVIPSEQIIPIYKDGFSKTLQEVVRYYQVRGVDGNGKPVIRKRVEWWTDKEVRKYVEDEAGSFLFDCVVPHWSVYNTSTPSIIEPHSWGRVPFVQLWNNDEGTGDLQDIKGHIDAYDLIQSEFVNQLADVREILIKVLGYSNTDAATIMKAFRATGIVKLDDKDGDIDILKTEIPVEARNAALKNLRDSIFLIGQGVDASPDKIGTSVSGIALKMLYGALDLKCNATIRKLKKALYQFMWFVCDDYNRRKGTAINYRDVHFDVNKNMIVNDSEIIDSLAKSKGIISDETIMEHHPYVTDPTLEEERMEKQQEKDAEQYKQAFDGQNQQPNNAPENTPDNQPEDNQK